MIYSVGYEAGDTLSSSTDVAVYKDASEVTMTVSVSQEDISAVNVGDTVEIALTAYEDKTYEGDADRIPIGRTGTGEDIGYMAAFLCSEEAGFITGADFLVDGGQACGENSMDATEDYDGIHGRGTYIVK